MLSASSTPAFPTERVLVCPGCRGTPLPRLGAGCGRCGYWIRPVDGYLDTSSAPTAPGFDLARGEHLASIEEGHFWFAARDRLVLRRIRRIAPDPGAIIELGCGTGRLLPALAGLAPRVVGVEIQRELLVRAVARGSSAELLRCAADAVPIGDGEFDLVVALDVLEHVDPAAFLREARRLLRAGGWLLLTVPASPLLWSDADVRAGHRCRYRVATLSAELRAAGFELGGRTHYQCFLFPALAVSRRLLRGQAVGLERRPPRLLSKLLGVVNRLEVDLLGGLRLPVGSSLVAWSQSVP
jgi:SAM-dependent methyltransferase